MITPEELTDLRDTGNASLPDLCDVRRITRVRQPNGTFKDVEALIYSAVRCRKTPSGQTPQEQALMDSATSTSDGIATFLLETAGIEVYKDDILVHTGDGGTVRYPVAGVFERSQEIYERVIVYDKSKAPV